jgi:hypothetical protein
MNGSRKLQRRRMMKRIFVLLLAALVALCLSAPAFAEKPIEFGVTSVKAKLGNAGNSNWTPGQKALLFYNDAWGKGALAVWGGGDGNPRKIFFADAWDYGSDIGPTAEVGTGDDHAITVAKTPPITNYPNGVVHVAWPEGDIAWYSRSENYGYKGSWEPQVQIATGSENPVIAADSVGNVYIAYYQPTGDNVYVVASTDGGVNWGTPVLVSSNSSIGSIAVDTANTVYVSYVNRSTGQLMYKSSADGWLNETQVSSTQVLSYTSTLAVRDPGSLCFAWIWSSNLISACEGDNWIERIVSPTGYAPSLAISPNGDVNVAWHDNQRIYFSRSTDGGASWRVPVQVYEYRGNFPSLTVGDDNKAMIMFFDTNWMSGGYGSSLAVFTREQ